VLNLITPGYAQEHAPTEGPAEAGVSHEVQESVGHAGADAHDAAHGAFPPFDPATYGSQLFWLALTFGALYLLMSRVALPRIGSILEERNNRISGDLGEAARLKGETDAAIAAYEGALAEARQRANAIAQTARDTAKAEVDAKRAGLEQDLENRVKDAETRIGEVKSRALADVDAIALQATSVMVEVLLGAVVADREVELAVRDAQAGRA